MKEMEQAQCVVVRGDEHWLPDVEPWVYKRPAEIEELEAASASGDLAAVQTLFEAQYLEKQSADRVEIDRFAGSFVAAMENNHLSIASYLLAQGVPINQSHFVLATEMRLYSFLQIFLDYGWDINKPLDSANPPALMLAIKDRDLTEWFLSHGADPNARCGSGLDLTPLSIAVFEAPFVIIMLLFDHGGSIEHGQLLHYAVRRNLNDRIEVLDFILAKGASVNDLMYQKHPGSFLHQERFGIGTPLHEAAEEGKLDVVEYLLARGASPLIRDASGKLAIERAERHGHTAVVEHLHSLSVSSD